MKQRQSCYVKHWLRATVIVGNESTLLVGCIRMIAPAISTTRNTRMEPLSVSEVMITPTGVFYTRESSLIFGQMALHKIRFNTEGIDYMTDRDDFTYRDLLLCDHGDAISASDSDSGQATRLHGLECVLCDFKTR